MTEGTESGARSDGSVGNTTGVGVRPEGIRRDDCPSWCVGDHDPNPLVTGDEPYHHGYEAAVVLTAEPTHREYDVTAGGEREVPDEAVAFVVYDVGGGDRAPTVHLAKRSAELVPYVRLTPDEAVALGAKLMECGRAVTQDGPSS